jgi:integrase
VQALTDDQLRAFYRKLETEAPAHRDKPLSDKTVHNIHLTLHAILQLGVRRRLLYNNPAAGAHRAPADPETRTWTASQLQQFLEFVRSHPLYAFFRLAATTGARRGEQLGLRWEDLRLDEGYMQIRRQYSRIVFEGDRLEGLG